MDAVNENCLQSGVSISVVKTLVNGGYTSRLTLRLPLYKIQNKYQKMFEAELYIKAVIAMDVYTVNLKLHEQGCL